MSDLNLENIVGFKAVDKDGNEQNVTVDEMVDMVSTRMVMALSETSTFAAAAATGNDVYENELPTVTDAANVRVLQSSGDAAKMTMQSLASKLGELIGTATGNKSGLMSVEDKKRLGRRFFKGYTKLVESKYWYNHYVALIFGASPASNLGSLIAIDWKGNELISVTRFFGNNDNVKLYLGSNPETNMYELWLGLIGLDGDGSEFIIQSRESIDLDSKTVETLPSYLKVISISWQKNNDFSELGELLQNAYDSYSLKESIETEIGVGLGVYYITQPNLASLSCIVIINYDNYQVLGMKGNLSFSVSLLKLTVVSKVGDIDINVRKILKQ